MFNFVSRPGRLLFSLVVKGNNNNNNNKKKDKARQHKRRPKTRQAQGKTRQTFHIYNKEAECQKEIMTCFGVCQSF